MKNIFSIAFVLILMATSNLFGQDEKVIPAYWVIETNVHQKNFTIVRLYDADNILIQEIRMDKFYDISKPKHKKILNELLKGYYNRGALTAKKNRTRVRRTLG